MPWGFAVGAGIGALGNIIGGGEQASGQEKAAQTQQNMFNTIVGQEQPFLTGGVNAETSLSQLLGTAPATGAHGNASGTNLPGGYLTQTFNPTQAQLNSYPGYQFQLQTGGQALENANTPGVGALSGPALKSLMGFNQDLAGTNYSNYFNQFQTQQNNIFNRLSNIASLGQNAAGNLGSAGANLGTGIAQAQAGAAGSIAGGIVGAANSASNGLSLSYLLGNGGGNTSGAAYADPQFQNVSNDYAQSQGYYPST
jgi:hypothetical protein